MNKPDRDELRKECNRKISDGAWSDDTGNVLNLLDALDEAEQTIQTLRELAPQPAPRDSEGKWQ